MGTKLIGWPVGRGVVRRSLPMIATASSLAVTPSSDPFAGKVPHGVSSITQKEMLELLRRRSEEVECESSCLHLALHRQSRPTCSSQKAPLRSETRGELSRMRTCPPSFLDIEVRGDVWKLAPSTESWIHCEVASCQAEKLVLRSDKIPIWLLMVANLFWCWICCKRRGDNGLIDCLDVFGGGVEGGRGDNDIVDHDGGWLMMMEVEMEELLGVEFATSSPSAPFLASWLPLPLASWHALRVLSSQGSFEEEFSQV